MRLIGHPYWLPADIRQEYPTLNSSEKTQVAVVGGSYAALTAAYYLTKQGYQVSVLEADLIGRASSRSAGVLSSSLERDFIDYVQEFGFEDAKKIWAFSVGGVELVKQLLEETNLIQEVEFDQPGSLYIAEESQRKFIQKEVLARQQAGFSAQYFENINNPLYEDNGYLGLITPEDSVINPYLFCKNLAKVLQNMGVKIYEFSKVVEIDKRRGICKTALGQIKADKLCLAGQNVPGQFGFKKGQIPLLTFCLATEPLTAGNLNALGLENRYSFWNTEMPFFYGRVTEDNRLLIGGQDLWKPLMHLGLPQVKLNRLETEFRKRIPILNNVNIEYRWGGPFYVIADAMPMIGQSGRTVFAGNCAGISQAVMAGRILATLIDNYQYQFDQFLSYKREILPTRMYSANEFFHLILDILGII